jgi:predicted nucleotidyltransferase
VGSSGNNEPQFSALERSLKRSVAAFEQAHIPFLLGGSLAAWARGGPETRNDLDFMLKREDADRALEALADEGMKPERPPEQWLVKAWDEDVLVDLIYAPQGMEITDEVIERGDVMTVLGVDVRVMALEDVLATKLLAIGEHNLDYESCLQIARSLREQISWDDVRARTAESPYARGFFTIVEGLGIVEPGPQAETAKPGQPDQPKVRIRAV